MCTLGWKLKIADLAGGFCFQTFLFSLSLLSTNQMERVWCSESVQNQVTWASCFVLSCTVLFMPISAIQATWGLRGTSGVSTARFTIDAHVASIIVSSTHSALQSAHTVTVFHTHPSFSSSRYNAQCAIYSQCIKKGTTQAGMGWTERELIIPGH